MNDGDLFIVMGVSGSGKSTIARLLAEATGGDWLDADNFHSEENKARMKSGVALTDDDRALWLDALNAKLRALAAGSKPHFLACSALKQKYRDRLGAGLPRAIFIYLRGSQELIRARLAERRNHFMSPSLLESQFADLEEPRDALILDISQTTEQIVEKFKRSYGLI